MDPRFQVIALRWSIFETIKSSVFKKNWQQLYYTYTSINQNCVLSRKTKNKLNKKKITKNLLKEKPNLPTQISINGNFLLPLSYIFFSSRKCIHDLFFILRKFPQRTKVSLLESYSNSRAYALAMCCRLADESKQNKNSVHITSNIPKYPKNMN